MDFAAITRQLSLRLDGTLPGSGAHLAMSSLRRIRELSDIGDYSAARESGVLILLYPVVDDLCTVMIQRPAYPGVHGGQISFPGGKREQEDRDLTATALRESREEIGIDPGRIRVLGKLTTLYIPPSNYLVQPVVAVQHEIPAFTPDPAEVDEVITLPLRTLLLPETRQVRQVSVGDWTAPVPCYYYNGRIIWGATAMILNELLEIIRAAPVLRW